MNSAPLSELPMVLLVGVLFDVQALAYFQLPFHLISLLPFQKYFSKKENLLRFFYLIGIASIILLNFIDLEFYKIKTRRSGIELFALISDQSNPIFSYLINYWHLLLLYIGLVFTLFKLYPKAKNNLPVQSNKSITAYFILFASIIFISARGGWAIKPLRSFDAARFVNPQWVSATINSPTQLITSYSSSVPPKLNYFSDSYAEGIAQTKQTIEPYFKNNFKPNIVLIILESIGRDYCGFLNKENRFTPFLDSLSKLSLVFPNAYSSGTTSMESIPAIFASIPSLLEVPYINSTFQNNSIYGIHHYLSKSKYNCSFYYGAKNGSMGFDNFLRISGQIDYFGLDEYPNTKTDFDGNWGIWDQAYLQYFNSELSKKAEPFFSSVFTLTSHDPYQIPNKYKGVFKGGQLPIYKAVQYTDHSLRLFFEQAAKQKWFKNTVFIITADHPSHSVNEYYYTPTGKYEIPLLVYAPKLVSPGVNGKITASHTDIMPSILSLAGIKDPFFSFGYSLFDSIQRYPINKDYGIAQLIDYPYCLRLYPDGKFKMHVQAKYVPNKLIRYQLSPAEVQKQKKMEVILKAKLQVYYNGLLNNKFNK
jgi:phosphoglycerol transferase MdoB-like AlkP superfamily enzyme